MRRTFPVLATALLVLGACGGPEWTTSDATVIAATADCEDGTNTQMRLRGWPPRPLAETPQDGARKAFFEDCMRRRGLTLE